jgi:CHAD domain-containing protein
MPHALDRSITREQRPQRKQVSRRQPISRRAIASPLSVPFKVATRPVHSVHDAALTLLDAAIETLRSGRDDGAVHAARKACKRVRAALRLLRECLGSDVYRRENKRIRDAAKPLTAVRDAFMLRKTLRAWPKRPPALQRGLDSEYRRERHALERRGARSALGRLTATREGLLDLPSIDSEAASVIAGVTSIYKAGRKTLRKARHRDDEVLHEWRKQAKYLLNQLGLLKSVFNAKFKKLHRRAADVAEVLGDDHDLGVLLTKLSASGAQDRSLMKNIKKRRRKLQALAFRRGKQLYRHSAKHIGAVMATRLLRSNESAGDSGSSK